MKILLLYPEFLDTFWSFKHALKFIRKKAGWLVTGFSGDNVDGTTNILPRMGLEQLRTGYREVLSHIYAPRFYYDRVQTFL